MVSLTHIEAALSAVDSEIKAILYNEALSLSHKDEMMLPLLRESKVLKQAHEDLCYLRDNPPSSPEGCKVGRAKGSTDLSE